MSLGNEIFNFNIGMLGHVDSGKTSLSRCLSTTASTAAFDKNPQSQERGITLDLGFSSLQIDAPQQLKNIASKVQLTLVDCPGHASLIRTIIAGAHIIDAMVLVVDVTKGIQTQTAECMIIGEILCNHLLVVLNKIDLLPPDKAKSHIEKMTKRLKLLLQTTKFGGDVKIIPVAARPGGGENSTQASNPVGMTDLIAGLQDLIYLPVRQSSGPAMYAVDHCFSIKGQGTVMTGTILQGRISVNDNIEIPSLNIVKKVKSMQMFRQPVETAVQGDRVGLCVTQFDPKLLERGLVCSPGLIKPALALIINVEKIPYYKLDVESRSKYHLSIGNETVMAKVSFFGTSNMPPDASKFNWDQEYNHQDKLFDTKASDGQSNLKPLYQFALVQFDHCVPTISSALVIGSKLDLDVHTSMCRIAFKGTALEIFCNKDYVQNELPSLKVFKDKAKEGIVERMLNDDEVIVKNLLKKDTNLQLFIGLKVNLSTGENGEIDGHFGTSGKIKVRICNGLTNSTIVLLQSTGKRKKGTKDMTLTHESPVENKDANTVKVKLCFKKYLFAPTKNIKQ